MKSLQKLGIVAGVGMLMLGGVAVAQSVPGSVPGGGAAPAGTVAQAPNGPMDGPGRGPGGGPEGRGGPDGWRRMHMREMMDHMPPPPPPSKAAHFRLRKGDAMIDVKCAETEPTKACVDAASALLDKAAAQK